MSWLSDPQVWASLVTLTLLETVLGIDNLVFIALLAGRVAPHRQHRARQVGLGLALISRLLLLGAIGWVIGFTHPLFELFGHAVSGRDVLMVAGGFFLLYKGTTEIHHRLEEDASARASGGTGANFLGTVLQIMVLDIVFSIDNVVTAVGMAQSIWVMAAAITLSVAVMLAASGPVAGFIERHPTVKMLALSFLLLIGMTLIADGAGFPVPNGYIYAAIAFSAAVEALNQVAAKRKR
jgi:predicted tellurium resistance membrane protein TerC